MKTTKEKRVSKNKAPAAWSSEERDIATVIPYEKNPRKNDQAVGAVAESIRQFGFRQPIVVDAQGVIIAGHTRLKAAQLLGLPKVPVHVAKELTPEQVRALRIADNKLHELAQWDVGILASELEGLVGMEALGFDENELKEIAFGRDAQRGLSDPDEVPEPPDEATTKPGDLWLLGEHRLLCGDSTKADDVARLMGGEKADLCFTDPPYGADIQYATHNDTQDALVGLIRGFMPLAMKYSDLVALTPGTNNIFLYDKPSWILCWFYGAGTGMSPWGFTTWQPILVFGKDPKLAHGEGCHPDGFQFMMSQSDATENRQLDHACPKPLSVWKRFLERLSHKDSRLIYEPFCGSGTTLIAAEQLGRKCYGMEISPQYCDVIVKRWEKFTGRKAERATG